jgi:hypothetical protein
MFTMLTMYEIEIDGLYKCSILATSPKDAITQYLDNGGPLLLSQRIEALAIPKGHS